MPKEFKRSGRIKMMDHNDKESIAQATDVPPLLRYVPGMEIGDLEEWPFTNPKSNYIIHKGDPKASGRLDSTTSTTRTGIWKCTKGSFECTEQGDELMTILTGVVKVTDVNTGQVVELHPGDSMFSRDGKRVIWDVVEDVVKVFYGFKEGGF